MGIASLEIGQVWNPCRANGTDNEQLQEAVVFVEISLTNLGMTTQRKTQPIEHAAKHHLVPTLVLLGSLDFTNFRSLTKRS